ncbi:MAG: GTPase, partial [Halospina sp.]
TPGLASAMNALFEVLENDFNNLMAEGRRAEKMVESIYRRHTNSGKERALEPVPLRLGRHLIALRDLRSRADRFRRDPRSLLMQQSRLIQQFLTTIVSEARQVIHRTMQDIDRWPGEALMPLLQHTQQQKQRLETQFRRLRHIVDDEKELKAEAHKLRQQRQTLDQQLRVARKLEERIAPPPGTQLP